MKLIQALFAVVFVLLIGGFFYVAAVDVPIEQTLETKEISNERFFSEG